jgi:hypothetical protein
LSSLPEILPTSLIAFDCINNNLPYIPESIINLTEF